jgi:hypothetical protein
MIHSLEDFKVYGLAMSLGDKFISEIEIIGKMINSYIKSPGDLKESANPEIRSPKSQVQSPKP